MKKIVFASIALVLSTVIAFTSFAAVSITSQFTDVDGCTYYFGTFDPATDTDAGVEVGGVSYNLNNPEKRVPENPSMTVWEKAVSLGGKFGIGLIDKSGLIDTTAEVKPYAVTGSEKVYGNSLTFDPNAEPTYVAGMDATLKSLTVAGAPISNFDPETRDYYLEVGSNGKIVGTNYSVSGAVPEVLAETTVSGATYEAKWEYFYNRSASSIRGGNLIITVTSSGGLTTKEYNVFVRRQTLLPVTDDSDVRDDLFYFKEGIHQGNYSLIYAYPAHTETDPETGEERTIKEIYTTLKFDITGLEDIGTAELHLVKGNSVSASLDFYKADSSDWDENTMTSATAPAYYGEPFATAVTTAGQTSNIDVDISDYLKECVANNQKYMNIAVRARNVSNNSYIYMVSKENSTTGNRPYITYTISDTVSEAKLSSLSIAGVNVQGFDPDTKDYYINVVDGKLEGTDYTLSSTAPSVEAATTINGATYETSWEYVTASSQETVPATANMAIRVTSKDGTATKKYIVHCVKAPYLMPDEDSDIRNSIYSTHEGHNTIIYTTKNAITAALKFDLTGVSNIETATLKLYRSDSAAGDLVFYKADASDWDEHTMVTATAPVRGNAFKTVTLSGSTITVDISDYINECIENNQKYMNIIIGADAQHTIYSKENTAAYRSPLITLTYKADPEDINANLKSLSVKGNSVPNFDPDVTYYYMPVANNGIDNYLIDNNQILAECDNEDAKASIKYEYFYDTKTSSHRSGNIVVTVTARDGVTTKTYTVHCYHPNVIPVMEDADVRKNNQGGYGLVYSTSSIYSLLKFDVKNLDVSNVKSATLYLRGAKAAVDNINLYNASNNWTEMEVKSSNYTYDTTNLIGNYSFIKGDNRYDITDYIKANAANNDYLTIMIGKIASSDNQYVSKETGNSAGYKPIIVIEYND